MKYLLLIFLSLPLYGQVSNEPGALVLKNEPSVVQVKDVAKPPLLIPKSIEDYREISRGSVMLGYQYFSTWIPGKWDASYTYIKNKKWSFEFEYASGSVGRSVFGLDIGRISEKKYSLVARRYLGNSFHFIFGGYKNEFRAKLGDSILDSMTNLSTDDFRVKGTGLALGLGNRWQWEKGVTLGIDWFRMNIPLINKTVDNDVLENIQDNSDASEVKDIIVKLKNIPTFVILGIDVGYTF
jgi:hypothetical protein